MKTKFTMTLTLFMALIVQLTFAQQKTVSGTVSDENGLPLIGATVVIVGTSSGTTTDFDGNYKITASQGDVLNFSYVGYVSQDVTVSNSNTINLTLNPDNALEEIVVQAFQNNLQSNLQHRRNDCNCATTIESRPNASFAQTLQGQVAGLNISLQGTDSLGGNSVINLRGVSSTQRKYRAIYLLLTVFLSMKTTLEV